MKLMRQNVPMHVRALVLYMTYSLIMGLATTAGLQVAMPQIMSDFHVPVTTAVWVMIAYSVALSGGTLALGGVTTFFDRRLLVVFGIAVDVILLAISFYTQSIYILIVCRFLSAAFRVFPWLILQVEGVGGFPPEQRGKAVGYTAMTQGVGMMLGLPFTGFVMDHFGWRWLFMGSAVVYLAMIPVVLMSLPKLPPTGEKKRLSDFDIFGSALMMTGMVSLITALQLYARGLGAGPGVLLLAVFGAGSLLAFVWVELHVRSPILQFSLFKTPGVSLSASQGLVMGITNGAFMLMLPFMFISGVGWSVAHVSSILFFQNVTRPFAGPVSGRLADRFGTAAVIFPAALLSLGGQIALASLGASPLERVAVLALILWGTGQALMQTANVRQIYASLPRDFLHLAPSINLVVMTLGTTSGQAFGSLAVQNGQDNAATGADFISYLTGPMLILSAFFAAGMIVTQLLPRLIMHSRRAEAPPVTEAPLPVASKDA